MVGVVRVENGSQSLGLRLESFLSGGVELATLLVEVLLSAEMFGFAVDVGAVLLLVATLASDTLGEVVVRAFSAAPAFVRELKAPSVSHALFHVMSH